MVVPAAEVATKANAVANSDVEEGQLYMAVQWLELKADGDGLQYELSDVQDCITAHHATGILPVMKLGRVALPKPGKKKEPDN